MDGSAGPGTKANGQAGASSSPAPPPPSPGVTSGEPQEEQQSSLAEVIQMWIKFAKTFAIIFPIYVLGYFEFSFSWILIGLAVLFYWRKNYSDRDFRINRLLAYLDHEDKAVKQNVPMTELPEIFTLSLSSLPVLHQTVKQMWPFICQFVDKLFRETIEPAVQGANAHLSTFSFTKIDMGDKPLRVNGVKVYTENIDKRQVIMDLQISFVGNTEIDVNIKKYYCTAGIKSIQLHGVLRVVMEPLLGDMPLIGALSVFFLKRPMLDINWTGLTNMLDIPGVNGLCDSLLQDIIYSYLVLPNRLNIPLVAEDQLAKLRFPIPKAVLRIHFIEAQELLSKDKILGGLIKGKSDPYGVLKLGTELFQSKVIKENLNPKWNEVYESLIYSNSGENLEVELFDEDTDKDDFLGSLMINLAELKKEQKVDEWFVLDDVASGKLHLKLEWLSLLSTPEKLNQVKPLTFAITNPALFFLSFLLAYPSMKSVFEGNLGSGCLKERRSGDLVFCENTSSLYRTIFSGKKVTSEPSPFVQFTVGHKTLVSKTKYKTNEPLWEETFTFLIHNPKIQNLEIEVKDEKHECSLGTITQPLKELLGAENMTLSQRFPIKNSGPNCSLKMKMALRVKHEKSPKPPSAISEFPRPTPAPAQDILNRKKEAEEIIKSPGTSDHTQQGGGKEGGATGGMGGKSLAETGRSTSNLNILGSQLYLAGGKESTPSIASDISNPYAAQELQQRLQQLQNGSGPSHFPLGEIQLTLRHSSQRNKLIVVVHSCRNLIAFTDHGSDPYVRLYLLPDKRRSGRRKTSTVKKTLNPVYDQTFEFNVSVMELQRRTLDVAVKNGGSLLSKNRGLLGKVLVDLTHDDITKGWTSWSGFFLLKTSDYVKIPQNFRFSLLKLALKWQMVQTFFIVLAALQSHFINNQLTNRSSLSCRFDLSEDGQPKLPQV
uniref:Extended synaptotagmin 2 n=1 Tax=Nothobranchius furzeri TaxID=105023 RepID=A0A8C6LRY2_NOTFU